MAIFSYLAIDKSGKKIKGTLDAESQDEALSELRQMGSVVVSMNEVGALSKDLNLSFMSGNPKPRDMSVFCRQFVSIISAGVPAVSALEMLGEQTENKKLAKALMECKKTIEQGETLAHAMENWPNVFPSMLITLVEAGEASGSLDISFSRMAEQFEKEAKLKATVKKATVYPIFIIIVAIIAVMALMTFVVPSFESMLSELDTPMPALTVSVLAIAHFLQKRWYLIAIIIIGAVMLLRVFSHTEKGQYLIGRITLMIPLLGQLTKKTAAARIARTLGTLMGSGLPLDDSLNIVSNTMSNIFFRDALIKAREAVLLGSPLAAQFKDPVLFPPLVHHMIGIGEETGSVENMLAKLAEYYEEEVENATQQLMAALEPLIILFMALMIGTIVISLIMPMASMYNGLNNL